MAVYIVDTNFFIQAHRDRYPLDVAIGFWEKVKELASNGTIVSLDKVKDEIFKNEDALKEWCLANLPSNFFRDSAEALVKYVEIINWAVSKGDQYNNKAIEEFSSADEADAWLVAYGCINGLSIVTYEIGSPNSKNKIKIPDACMPFSVRTLKPIDMFRELGERF